MAKIMLKKHKKNASIGMQRLYRGIILRRRLETIKETNFLYVDKDLDEILEGRMEDFFSMITLHLNRVLETKIFLPVPR